MVNTKLCPVCKGSDIRVRFTMPTPYLDRTLSYSILSCNQCEFYFADGPADNELLTRIYSENFHASEQQYAKLDSEGALGEKAQKFPVVTNALNRVRWLHECGIGGRLLDVGAGRGYFVKAAEDYFQAEGIELSEHADAYGRELGVVIKNGDFLKYDFDDHGYDVITLWDVLASLKEPNDVMERVYGLLKPGGVIVMTLPRVSGLVPKLLGKYWPLWIPPVNLGYYSEKNIEYLLTNNGFELQSMKCYGKRVAVSFLITKLGRTLGIKYIETAASIFPRSWKLTINLHDIVTVVAKRRETFE